MTRPIATSSPAPVRRIVGDSGSGAAVSEILRELEAKHPQTFEHSLLVARFANELCAAMGVDATTTRDIVEAAAVHDLGKLEMTPIIDKAGKLSPAERAIVETHPARGWERLESHHRSLLSHTRDGVLHHHENFDGTGYPDRLRGARIPKMARILRVADVAAAMVDPNRAYRSPATMEEVMTVLRDGAGTLFDPAMVDAFVSWNERNASSRRSPRPSVAAT